MSLYNGRDDNYILYNSSNLSTNGAVPDSVKEAYGLESTNFTPPLSFQFEDE